MLPSVQEALSKLKLDNGISIYELSKKHRIVLSFIKWLGCPICQKEVANLGNYLSSFLKLNVIPIVCHMEKMDEANSYFENCRDPNVKILPHVHVPGEVHQVLGVPHASLWYHCKSMHKIFPKCLGLMVKEKRQFKLPKTIKYKDLLRRFALFMVENGVVINSFEFTKLTDRPDYGKFILNLDNTNGVRMETSEKLSSEYYEQLISLFPQFMNAQTPSDRKPKQTKRKTEKDDKFPSEVTLQHVLENSQMRMYFKAFASNEYCSENILFYEEVQLYKRSMKMMLEKRATKIVKTYLQSDSLLELNISVREIDGLKERLLKKGFTDTLFDPIVDEIQRTALCGMFYRFRKSKLFMEMLGKVKLK